MEWSEENILILVETYKLFKHLWDPKDKDYFKKEKKVDAWNEIASAVGTSAEACKKKISNLLATYRKERNKVKSSMGTGKATLIKKEIEGKKYFGTDEVYSSRWFAYEAFRFLEDRDRPRQGLNTEEMVDTEEQIEGDNSQLEENGGETQNAQETNVARTQSSTIERPAKRVRKQEQLHQSFMEDAIGLMKTAASKLKAPFSDTREDVKAFGNYIISKMKSYSEQTRKGVEHAIFDVIIKADRGFYENSIPSTSAAPSYHTLQVFPTQPPYSLNYSQPDQTFSRVSKENVISEVISISSPVDSQYLTSSTPSPRSTESLPRQPQQSLIIHSQPSLGHQKPSRGRRYNSTAVNSPEGSHYSTSFPSPLSPSESINQQSSTLSQSHPYNQNMSTVHNTFTSSDQNSRYSDDASNQYSRYSNDASNQRERSQYSNNAPSTHLAQLSDDSNGFV